MFKARFWPITARPARPIRERAADSIGEESVERDRESEIRVMRERLLEEIFLYSERDGARRWNQGRKHET